MPNMSCVASVRKHVIAQGSKNAGKSRKAEFAIGCVLAFDWPRRQRLRCDWLAFSELVLSAN